MSKALFICSRSLDVMKPLYLEVPSKSYWVSDEAMVTQIRFIHYTHINKIHFGFSLARGLQKLHWNEAIIWLNVYSLLKPEIMSNYLHLSALYEMSVCVCAMSVFVIRWQWASGDGILMCRGRFVCVCGLTWM